MRTKDVSAAALGFVAALATPASAFWRMPCPGRLVLERIDPIISPGVVSSHVHTVSGGSGFGFAMDYAQARSSKCSSCPIKADFSNYWTPKLYYMGADGKSFEDVPQAGEGNGVTGGLTVYYEQRPGPGNDPLKAFPEEFRMVAGDPWQRNFTNQMAAPGQAVSFVCLDYTHGSSHSNEMPNKNCPDGLRAQVYFPSCWDGVNKDSADHKSHMAYPIGSNAYDNGRCPSSHPVHLVSIFYEVIYQTGLFADRWHSKNHHPFVFAQGDRTGYGFHGDFVNGWDIKILQQAIDECNDDSGNLSDCPVFDDLFSNEECQMCRIPPSVDEAVTGTLESLPGCNKISNFPAYASPQPCSVTPIGQPMTYYTDVTKSLGWEYVGCANDSMETRTLSADSTTGNDMTVEKCINYCKGKGFSLAGMEYASQCYCDNKFYQAPASAHDVREPQAGILGNCWQPCAGDAGEICGGSAALSVYKACDGGSCVNSQYTMSGNTTSDAKKQRRNLHSLRHRHARHHFDS